MTVIILLVLIIAIVWSFASVQGERAKIDPGPPPPDPQSMALGCFDGLVTITMWVVLVVGVGLLFAAMLVEGGVAEI